MCAITYPHSGTHRSTLTHTHTHTDTLPDAVNGRTNRRQIITVANLMQDAERNGMEPSRADKAINLRHSQIATTEE